MKIRADGELAVGTPAFVDDGRITGVSKDLCDKGAHQFCTRINYLGEQSAARKRRPTSLQPGAWTGKLLWTNEPHPKKGILAEKWRIQRDDLFLLRDLVAEGKNPDRSFFVSLICRGMSQTEVYWDLRPYYKSFYNALEVEVWRSNRDAEGWRMEDGER